MTSPKDTPEFLPPPDEPTDAGEETVTKAAPQPQPSPLPSPAEFDALIPLMLVHMPLVAYSSDGCDGLFAQISEKGVARLYETESERVDREIILLNDALTGGDPKEFLSRSKRRDLLLLLKAKAITLAARRPVAKRLYWSEDEKAIYLDLGLADGRNARITAAGWDVVGAPLHPLFVRYPMQRPLPEPLPCDDGHAAFQRMLPPGLSPETQKLILGAMIGFMLPPNFTPGFAFPILGLFGEAGSGKTQLSKLIKRLLDNERAVTSARASSADNLYVAARTSHLLAFDNLDRVPPTFSDTLCQITTGASLVKRTLYTDHGLTVVSAHGPILLNGIHPEFQREDFVDRSIIIQLQRIARHDADAGHRAEAELPYVLGYLLDLLSRGLRNYATTRLENPPRLAALARMVTAAEPFGCPTPFVDLLHQNQRDAIMSIEDGHPVIDALYQLMTALPIWHGTVKDLLAALAIRAGESATRSPEWPRTPRKLSAFLKSRMRTLRETGISADPGAKHNTGRLITVKRLPAFKPQTTS